MATVAIDRRKDERALFLFKIRSNEFHEYLMSMFNTSNNKNYTLKLRNNELDFALPYNRIQII